MIFPNIALISKKSIFAILILILSKSNCLGSPSKSSFSTVASTDKIKKSESFSDKSYRQSAILTLGVVDLSAARPTSSIILVLDGKARNGAIAIDEDLLQKIVASTFRHNTNDASISISPKSTENDENAILESLAIICDVLVLRTGEADTLAPALMPHVLSGKRQRESTGMLGGKHWLCSKAGNELRQLGEEGKGDNNIFDSSKTTWATLFSSTSNNENEMDDEAFSSSLKELFSSFSQQVIWSKRQTTSRPEKIDTERKSAKSALADLLPRVSVLCINQEDKHDTIEGEQTNQLSSAATQDSSQVKTRTQKIPMVNEVTHGNTLGRTNQRQHEDEVVGDVIGLAYRQLEDLEEKMQESILDQFSNTMPLLDFGTLVQDILETAERQLIEDKAMHASFRRGLMKGIIVETQRLYNDQLQALRNYYGKRYESLLAEDLEDYVNDQETIERKWAIGAEHMTQAFLAAARNAVPAMYQANPKEKKHNTRPLYEASFDHVDALQGLLQDMIESTERCKDEQNVATILVDTEREEGSSKSAAPSTRKIRMPKLPKWLERLAARAFVFGVNYIQGWLAWQGIKRAALERDRTQPKFPLF